MNEKQIALAGGRHGGSELQFAVAPGDLEPAFLQVLLLPGQFFPCQCHFGEGECGGFIDGGSGDFDERHFDGFAEEATACFLSAHGDVERKLAGGRSASAAGDALHGAMKGERAGFVTSGDDAGIVTGGIDVEFESGVFAAARSGGEHGVENCIHRGVGGKELRRENFRSFAAPPLPLLRRLFRHRPVALYFEGKCHAAILFEFSAGVCIIAVAYAID